MVKNRDSYNINGNTVILRSPTVVRTSAWLIFNGKYIGTGRSSAGRHFTNRKGLLYLLTRFEHRDECV